MEFIGVGKISATHVTVIHDNSFLLLSAIYTRVISSATIEHLWLQHCIVTFYTPAFSILAISTSPHLRFTRNLSTCIFQP